MSFGGVLLATTALSAVNQIGQGYAQKAEAKYNASVANSQAEVIQMQKEIEFGQYQRMKGEHLSTSMANVAASGIMPSGSAMAALVRVQKDIAIDQAIGQFNLEQERTYKLAESDKFRRQGRQAVYSGYMGAFSSSLSGLSNYGMYKGWGSKSINTDSGAKSAS